MASFDKDFRIKNGLVVQGSTATVNGNNVLTEASSINALSDVVLSTTVAGQVLKYNGTNWINDVDAGGSGVTVSDTAPSSPSEGDLWFNSTTGRFFIYYDSFWVEVSSSGSTGGSGDTISPFLLMGA